MGSTWVAAGPVYPLIGAKWGGSKPLFSHTQAMAAMHVVCVCHQDGRSKNAAVQKERLCLLEGISAPEVSQLLGERKRKWLEVVEALCISVSRRLAVSSQAL